MKNKEIIDRVHYMYAQTDGSIKFPNNYEGDLIKLAYKDAVKATNFQDKLSLEMQEVLVDSISNYINLDDTYVYTLTRVKEAFAIGTVSLDDFIEWDEDIVMELAENIIKDIKEKINLGGK